MKNFTLKAVPFLGAFLLASNGFAATSIIKTCSTVIPSLGSDRPAMAMKMEVLSDGESIKSRVTQNGQSYEDIAEIKEESVGENIPTELGDPSIDDFNMAERLISHAIIFTSNPDLGGKFSAGIDLSKVRSAKLYIVGKQTNMGSMTIVEAKDENGMILGSFLGGFLVTPCE